MKFTQDWFSHNIPNMEMCMGMLPWKQRFLEIGCFEGRATVWFLEHGMDTYGSSITCIDTFKGSAEHVGLDMDDLYSRFQANMGEALGVGQRCEVIRKTSYEGLADLIKNKAKFDFIYVDGSHTAYDTMTDACMAWPMLQRGGIMLFDDYKWDAVPGEVNQPKLGIDGFLKAFNGQFEMFISNYQLGVRKI